MDRGKQFPPAPATATGPPEVSPPGPKPANPDAHAEIVADGLVPVPEGAKFLAIGKSLLYELMAKGELPFVKIRGRRLIPRRALVEYAAKHVVNQEVDCSPDGSRAGTPAANDPARAKSIPFIPTRFQQCLLDALNGRALTADALEGELRVDRRRLYRDGLNELKRVGRVKNHSRVGYYRPDAPPACYAKELAE